MTENERFMQRAIRLAMNGRGRVEPNPMVGCVIVKEGRIIGEGYHEQFGGPHAEPNALAACTESPEGATAYVTLEPCCHTNKKTPPCVPRFIEARLGRMVVGCLDPNPQVDGGGVAMLKGAGVEVTTSVLEPQCRQLIAPFLAGIEHARPYVTLKWAQTADGKVAGPGGNRLQISNARSMLAVHRLRSRCDAILVGVGTVVTDDPLLTPRDVKLLRPFVRCVLDTNLRTPIDSRLITTAREHPVVIFCARDAAIEWPERAAALQQAGVEIAGLHTDDDEGRPLLEGVLAHLHGRGVTHLLVEPGPTTAKSFSFMDDRVWIFRSPLTIDDTTAPAAPELPGSYIPTRSLRLGDNTLHEYLNTRSPVFFDSTTPSADFLLESVDGLS